MSGISVQSEIEQALMQLQSLAEAKNFRFAVAKSLTNVAQEIQAEVVGNMPNRFTLRRTWIQKGIRVIPATKEALESTVYSRDSQFMDIQETGGAKTPTKRRYLMVPTSLVRRTKTDLIKRSDKPKSLYAAGKVDVVEVKGEKFLALKRPRKGNNDQRLRLLYLMIPVARIQSRLGLREDGQRIAKARFTEILQANLAAAVAQSR